MDNKKHRLKTSVFFYIKFFIKKFVLYKNVLIFDSTKQNSIMKKVSLKVINHDNKSFLTITAQDSNNRSNPLLFTYEHDTKTLAISCKGGCSLELDKDQIQQFLDYVVYIDFLT